MDFQQQYIGGKAKQTFIKRGQEYTRKGYDIKVALDESFKKKCFSLGESQSGVVAKLVEAFVRSNGWGPETRQAPVFEHKVACHVQDAVRDVSKGMYP